MILLGCFFDAVKRWRCHTLKDVEFMRQLSIAKWNWKSDAVILFRLRSIVQRSFIDNASTEQLSRIMTKFNLRRQVRQEYSKGLLKWLEYWTFENLSQITFVMLRIAHDKTLARQALSSLCFVVSFLGVSRFASMITASRLSS
jgi:hypothetical protein